MTMTHQRPESETGHRREAAPRMVIDERGREVGVLLGHAEYIALLAHLAARADPEGGRSCGPVLPAYWRRALARWIPGAALGPDVEIELR